MSPDFADYFSLHAADYARHRSTYPSALFEFLVHRASGRRLAPADAAPLRDSSCDLVAVVQALHWFAGEPFYRESVASRGPERSLSPGRTTGSASAGGSTSWSIVS